MKLHAPGVTKMYNVTGLNIDLDKLNEINLTITSDKLYANQEVPYDASVRKHDPGQGDRSSASLIPVLYYMVLLPFAAIVKAW